MTKNEKRLIKSGIVIPVVISILLAVCYILISSNLGTVDAQNIEIANIESASDSKIVKYDGEKDSTAAIASLKDMGKNYCLGDIEVGNDTFELMYNADPYTACDRFNINIGNTLVGETGTCFAEVYKNHASSIKLLAKGDTININTFYSSYEYTVEDAYTVKNLHDLKNAGAGLGRALVLYTDNSVGAGISDEYFVCVATMKTGEKIGA